MLGHAKAVVDGAIAGGSKQARRPAQLICGYADNIGHHFRRILRPQDKFLPVGIRLLVASFSDEVFFLQTFRQNHVRQCSDQGDVGARPQFEMIIGLHMG